MSLGSWFEAVRDNAAEWAEGRSPWVRGALTSYLAYAGVRHIATGVSGEYRSWFAGITLVFHEMGHLVFAPFGHTLMLLGGSLLQLIVPSAAGLYLLFRQGDWFGLAVCGAWLSTSLCELATYIDDANQNNLPLVGMGDNVEHDWDALLTQWHLLNHAQTFAAATRWLGIGIWALSISFSVWLILQMWRARQAMAANGQVR